MKTKSSGVGLFIGLFVFIGAFCTGQVEIFGGSDDSTTNALPQEYREAGQETFAEGNRVFIWDAEKGQALRAPTFFPLGSRKIGFAFKPKERPAPFRIRARVKMQHEDATHTMRTASSERPKSTGAIGSSFTTGNLARGRRGTVYFVVVEGAATTNASAEDVIISNEIPILLE